MKWRAAAENAQAQLDALVDEKGLGKCVHVCGCGFVILFWFFILVPPSLTTPSGHCRHVGGGAGADLRDAAGGAAQGRAR